MPKKPCAIGIEAFSKPRKKAEKSENTV